jgi:DNA polymerase-1
MSDPRLLLVDGHAVIYRAYHAFPALSTSEGMLVNAVYGFGRILLVALRDLNPEHVAVTFDHRAPTFRHTAFKDYKAQRPAMPEDLRPQIDLVKELVTSLNIPRFELEGFEADDLIGTITLQQEQTKRSSLILTGDKDAFQLVTDLTHVLIPGRGPQNGEVEYDAAAVEAKMGVTPAQIIDLKALMGDPSDNIPGVAGVGPKTAAKLIQTFGTVAHLYEVLADLSVATPAEQALLKGAVLTKLQTDKESALMSQQLATIDRHVPLEFSLPKCRVNEYDKTAVTAFLEKLQFNSLLPLLPLDDFEQGVQSALF